MLRNLVLSLVVLSLTGCQSIKLSPGAEQVRLTLTEPNQQCEYLGDITGNQGDFFTGEFTSNANLETGARHDLKNKALALGGNTVFLLTQRAGQTASYDSEFGGGSQQTNVTLSGNVYRCPRTKLLGGY